MMKPDAILFKLDIFLLFYQKNNQFLLLTDKLLFSIQFIVVFFIVYTTQID